jgi:molybdopterin molybdotransferase
VSELIAIEEARRRVLAAVEPLASEDVGLEQALGRVLAEEVRSEVDVPPFDSSAMDGYAVVAGAGGELDVVAESRAGHPAATALRRGTAIAVSTGAAVPEGATAVVPVERTEASPDGARRIRVPETEPGANIRRAGEDLRAGHIVLRPGDRLGPAELGVAASLGRGTLRCARGPRVVLILTGDELTDPGQPLGPGRIYSSNGVALAAQAERAGAALLRHETVGDTLESTREALGRALDDADVVLVSGGVSVGPHDHVNAAFRELGVEERFWGVRLRPGKPTWFGTRGRILAFGLPGNPVSAMVTFQLFVRPALAALQGADAAATRATALLDEPVARTPRREQAVRVRLRASPDGWRASLTRGAQGSHILTSMLRADALALIAAGEGEVSTGESVEVELL